MEEEKPNKPKSWPVPNKLFTDCLDAYDRFCKRELGWPMKGGAIEGNAMKQIIRTVRSAFIIRMEKEPTNEDILMSWNVILSNYHKWGYWKGRAIELPMINSKLRPIMENIRSNASSTKQVGLSPEEQEELKQYHNG